jgi:NADP-dependent 3-hydroxy acid dehydrogenase YdfG
MHVTLENQVVLVVGASSGVGHEAALLFAREGAKVMASGRRQARLRELQETLAKEQIAIEIHSADATKPAEMETLAQYATERFGKIDILVYTSGTNTPDRALTRLTPDIWDAMMSVNLNGAYYVTRAVLPAMRERGSGQLIYVSSISGHTPDVSGAAYQASKRGLIGLAHAIRVEEKERGIRTCVVCPGLIDTELLNMRPVKPTAEMLAKALQPVDVAEAILSVAKLPPRAAITELTIVPTYI